jgi:hypothetical protein
MEKHGNRGQKQIKGTFKPPNPSHRSEGPMTKGTK